MATEYVFFTWITSDSFPDSDNPINKQVLLFYVINAEALKGSAPFLGKIKFDNLNNDFFI